MTVLFKLFQQAGLRPPRSNVFWPAAPRLPGWLPAKRFLPAPVSWMWLGFKRSWWSHFVTSWSSSCKNKSLQCALISTWLQNCKRKVSDILVPLLWTSTFTDLVDHTPWTPVKVVFYAAVYRAFETAKTRTSDALTSMQKGQLVLLGKSGTWPVWILEVKNWFFWQYLDGKKKCCWKARWYGCPGGGGSDFHCWNGSSFCVFTFHSRRFCFGIQVNFPIEITYDEKKFSFQVMRRWSFLAWDSRLPSDRCFSRRKTACVRTRPDTFSFTINGKTLKAKARLGELLWEQCGIKILPWNDSFQGHGSVRTVRMLALH